MPATAVTTWASVSCPTLPEPSRCRYESTDLKCSGRFGGHSVHAVAEAQEDGAVALDLGCHGPIGFEAGEEIG